MTSALATILKDKLSNIDNGEGMPKGLLFIDKIAGLVQMVERQQPTEVEGIFSVSKFPVSIDIDYEDCFNSGCFKDMVPNSKLKGILYFEEYGTKATGMDKSKFQYNSLLRLVVWINNKLIQGQDCKSINHILITQIRKTLEVGYFNCDDFSKIHVKTTNIILNDYRLFSRYSYPKEVIKYLMHPYEAFGLELSIDYSVNDSCFTEFELNPTSC